MAKIEDCPGFEPFGADVKAARKQMRLSRQKVAEAADISQVYLVNIENDHVIPSLPVIIQLVHVLGLPVEKYFGRSAIEDGSGQRQRVSQKVKLCPEEYLPIIEGALDGAIRDK